jgi:hypothetical protein
MKKETVKYLFFTRPPKLYIQIRELTDDKGYSNFYGTYCHTIPFASAFSRNDFTLSYDNPVKKYVYDDNESTYLCTKDIYWDHIKKY